MKKVMMAMMSVVVMTAFTVAAQEAADMSCPADAGAGACCAAMSKPEVKATCAACAACKESGAVCEKCAAKKHLLVIKDGKAYCCGCGKDCKCTMKEGDTKCSCGKDIKTCNLKGKFVCDCPVGCKCNKIYDKAGKCECGKELKEVM